MTLKTPNFWYRPEDSSPSCLEHILTPISAVYGFLYTLDQSIHSKHQANIPVFCIGNISAGGTGKTPTAIAFMNTIRKHELAKNPYFLIRGYGGAEDGPLLANPKEHTAWDIGDEALILAEHAPTIVACDRAAGAQMAEEHGADMLIMDDGLQNPGIYKDLRFVVINGEMGFGNQKLMPAGPLRQPLKKGFEITDGFILIGEDERNVVSSLPANTPLLKAQLKGGPDFKADKNAKYIAFAGLGYPQKFFNFLKNTLGLDVVESIAYSDHHPYEEDDLQALHEKAQNLDAKLITTEKDFMRLPQIDGIDVVTVPVEMHWNNENALVNLLKKSINERS